jgi:hypothetical protein
LKVMLFPSSVEKQTLYWNVWGSHGGDYEKRRLLGCYAVWLLQKLTFLRNLSPTLSGWKESAS